MSGYRFCRSDDVPLLVEAYNACYRPHFPGLLELSVEGFKRLTRELDLWTSSCMVALGDDGAPIAVLLAAKRERENLIYRVGVHPEHQRSGHGRHLLDSLSQKMAILGPPRLLAEVGATSTGPRRFLERCGYRQERTYRDFVLSVPPEPPPEAEQAPRTTGPFGALAVTLEEVRASGLLPDGIERCWERSDEAITNRAEKLQGFGLVGGEAIEAYVLFCAEGESEVRVAVLGSRQVARRETMLALLLRHMSRPSGPARGRSIRIPRAAAEEVPFEVLERVGFERGRETILYVRQATAPVPRGAG